MTPKQKKTTVRQKVRNTLYQLGMQAKAKQVIETLAKYGLAVTEGFVERVRIAELKGRKREENGASTFNRMGKRHQTQKIPQKRPRRK